MATPVATPDKRRRRLVVAGLAVAAGALAWWSSRPTLPEFNVRRVGDLVFLEPSGGGALDAALVGLGERGETRPPPTVDRARLETTATAPMLGEAGTTVVAFSDYRCPSCRSQAADWLARAERGELRFVMRDWPILGPPSVLAARAAIAAGAQDGYWAMHRALMGTSFVPTAGLIETLARDAGMDEARLFQDMNAPWIEQRLAHNAGLARAIRAPGTPVYVVDGVVVRGAWPIDLLLDTARRYRVG